MDYESISDVVRYLRDSTKIVNPDPLKTAIRVACDRLESLAKNTESKSVDAQKYLDALAEIEAWKDASGLIDGRGDPDGVTPDAARRYWKEIEDKWIADDGVLREIENKLEAVGPDLIEAIDGLIAARTEHQSVTVHPPVVRPTPPIDDEYHLTTEQGQAVSKALARSVEPAPDLAASECKSATLGDAISRAHQLLGMFRRWIEDDDEPDIEADIDDVRGMLQLAHTECRSVADDSDLIDEDPLPSAHADNGFWQWRSYSDGTYDAKAPGAIAWTERLRSPRDVWAVLHGWVDVARTTDCGSVDRKDGE